MPIYAIGMMQAMREYYDARGPWARSSGWTFRRPTTRCGRSPRRPAGRLLPALLRRVSEHLPRNRQALRNQYALTYQPSNQAKDGKFRKIKVELVNPATNEPLRIVDEKGKPMKYTIVAKAGYNAPREVE